MARVAQRCRYLDSWCSQHLQVQVWRSGVQKVINCHASSNSGWRQHGGVDGQGGYATNRDDVSRGQVAAVWESLQRGSSAEERERERTLCFMAVR